MRQRRAWFDAYVRDVVSREALRPLADVRLETELRRVLRLLAARTAGELVVSDLAADAELARETTANYVGLLEALYLVVRLPAWATSATTRAKRRSKVLILDTGLAADLCGAGEAEFGPRADGRLAGALFETLVLTEAHKQTAWCERSLDLAHFRDRQGAEIDLIVEDRHTGQFAVVEVKLTSTPVERDARHLARFRDRLGERFTVGLVVRPHVGAGPTAVGAPAQRAVARRPSRLTGVLGAAPRRATAAATKAPAAGSGGAPAPPPIPPTAAMPPAGTPGWR
ncbi:MAG: ATP-binding protein [Egibacteraceae bacterium]